MPTPGESEHDLARLSPEMASFRALVLDFVAGYIARWGQSPSYGEIAAGTNSNRTRVKRAVVSLERKGLLIRAGGVRGLSLPDEIERARQTLERAGLLPPERPAGPQGRKQAEGRSCPKDTCTAARSRSGAAGNSGEDASAEALAQNQSVTKPTLLPPPALDYPARGNHATRGNQQNGSSGASGTAD